MVAFNTQKRGLFGSRPRIPGIDPIEGQYPDMGGFPPGLGQNMPQNGQKPGLGTRLFGKGWEGKAYALGGLLAGDGGRGVGMYHQQQAMQQQAAQQAAAAQAEELRKRSLDRADKQWEWQNKPQTPHYWETNDGSLASIDPATGKPRVVYQDPTPKIDWITAQNPDGTKTLVPMQRGGAPAGGALPTFTDDDWNKAAPVKQMSVTPRELDALVNKYGPQAVQRRLDSGELSVRN